MIFAFQLIY